MAPEKKAPKKAAAKAKPAKRKSVKETGKSKLGLNINLKQKGYFSHPLTSFKIEIIFKGFCFDKKVLKIVLITHQTPIIIVSDFYKSKNTVLKK